MLLMTSWDSNSCVRDRKMEAPRWNAVTSRTWSAAVVVGLMLTATGCARGTAATSEVDVSRAPGGVATRADSARSGAVSHNPSNTQLEEKYERAARAVTRFGEQAGRSEGATVAKTVEGYLAAVASHAYPRACRYLASDLRHPSGRLPPTHVTSCPKALSVTFQEQSFRWVPRLVAHLVVKEVRGQRHRGYVLLSFGMSGGMTDFIPISLENGQWTVAARIPSALRLRVEK
jgi:hypothetical protein